MSKKLPLKRNREEDLRVFTFTNKPLLKDTTMDNVVSFSLEEAFNLAKAKGLSPIIYSGHHLKMKDYMDLAYRGLDNESSLINMAKLFRDTMVKNKKDKESMNLIIAKVVRRIKKIKK